MIDKKVSLRYAKALIELCEENNINEENVLKELKNIGELLKNNKKLYEYLTADIIPLERKTNIIKEIANEELFFEFLKYIAKRRRFKLIFDIIDLFEDLVYEKHNRVKAYVKSAIKLEDKTKEKLKEQLSKKLNKEIEFEFKVDRSIIGGIIVQVKDVIYDGSLKTYLTNLRHRLLKLPV